MSIAQHRLHLNATNIVVDDPIDSNAAGVDFSLAEFKGTSSRRRAFVLARVARGEVPAPRRIDFDDAARFL
ncbi:MAG TPA: hypothetical protein PLX65_05745 [Accumulibacter sp.]|nr:hypothetical protein [Accumulibacter sp.]